MRDRILILKPSSLGDVVQTLPALAAIRRGRPQAHVSWAVNPEWAPLLEENPLLDAVHIFPRQRFRGPAGTLAFANWLRREPAEWKIDTVLDFQGLLRSGLIARATGAERRVGLDDSREGARLFYNQVVPTKGILHSVERYLRLAEIVGAVAGPIEYQLGPGEPIENFTLAEKSYLVLHPFSRGRGKSLTPADVGVFCRAVHPLPVVVVGRGKALDANLPDNALDLREQTSIPQLIWLLQRAGATVSVDSGPMHLAVATGPADHRNSHLDRSAQGRALPRRCDHLEGLRVLPLRRIGSAAPGIFPAHSRAVFRRGGGDCPAGRRNGRGWLKRELRIQAAGRDRTRWHRLRSPPAGRG